jgi:hypothetical protein
MATLQQIITALPVGKSNAKKVSEIEKAIGNRPSGTNNDQTRREVKSAIYDNKIPIGSYSHAGYWLIDSDAECEEVVKRLNSTIDEFITKRDAILSGWDKRKKSKLTGKTWPK